MEVAEHTISDRVPRCDDCRIPTRLRASIFDPRKDSYVKVYDCSTLQTTLLERVRRSQLTASFMSLR